MKRDLISGCSSDLASLIFALGRNGKILVLDYRGNYVSTISREGECLTAVHIRDE
jgi:hypothetical protein